MKKQSVFIIILLCISIGLANAQSLSGSFQVGGDLDKFYPVVFEDSQWDNNRATTLEIGRSNTHQDGQWRGAMIAKFDFHTSRWGHGGAFIKAEVNQIQTNEEVNPFVAGWKDLTRENVNQNIVIWLKGGGTTYYFYSNGQQDPEVYDGVQNSLPLENEEGEEIVNYTYKTTIDNETVGNNTETLLIDKPSQVLDWNVLWQNGFYDSDDGGTDNVLNAPENGSWFWGLNIGHRSNNSDYRYGGQIAIRNSFTAPTMYFRSKNLNGNGIWAKVLHSVGNQGIGTENPLYPLHIEPGKMYLGSADTTAGWALSYLHWAGHSLVMGTPAGHYAHNSIDLKPGGCEQETLFSQLRMYTATGVNEQELKVAITTTGNAFFNNDGNFGIGTETPDYKLDVNGTMRAKEIVVNLNDGADFVFDDNYKLMNLNELDAFVQSNKHLPEVAPAAEMVENGVDMGEMQIKLLQKIEELTLYIIAQDKRITELENNQNK